MEVPQVARSTVDKQVILIAAMDQKRAIGKAGTLPWHLPEDLAHFKRLTMNQTILMGRKTFDSIGKALPKRRNLVLTRNPEFNAPNAERIACITQALALAIDALWVIGGEEIYKLALPFATRLEITQIDTLIKDADAFFPAIPAEFNKTAEVLGLTETPKLVFQRFEKQR
jgi:dihydrofolate reductase